MRLGSTLLFSHCRPRLRAFLFAIDAVVALSIPLGVEALTLDQASESGSGLGTLGQPDNAQTFTIGVGGRLKRVEVEIRLNDIQSEDLLFDIRPAPGGFPSDSDSTALATGVVHA